MLHVNSTSGSFSSVAALSLILMTGMSRPSYELPMLDTAVMSGCADDADRSAATTSSYVW
jgi:hypothetical protein